MTDFLTLPEFGFLRAALLFTAAASVTFGLIGTFVVVRRIGYLAGAISHCAFGGIGIGFWLKEAAAAGLGGFGTAAALFAGKGEESAWLARLSDRIDPVVTAILVAVGSAILIGAIQKFAKEREDALIGILWTLGMAVGLLFLDKTKRYVAVSDYLLGDVLLISKTDIVTILILGAGVTALTLLLFKRLEAVCFDEEFARLRGIHVDFYLALLLFLIAISVVLTIRIVGMVLVIALLTIPASIASRLTKRLGPTILYAIGFSFLGCWLGIGLSYFLNFSAGPMIVIVVALFYFIVLLISGKR